MALIDAQYPVASFYLWLGGAAFGIAYGLPLFLFPIRWARWFRWQTHEQGDLTVYFGRCLGGLILALVFGGFRAAPHAGQNGLFFEVLVAAFGAMIVAHVWGAVRRAQPWTETVEILLYLAFGAAAWWIRTGLP